MKTMRFLVGLHFALLSYVSARAGDDSRLPEAESKIQGPVGENRRWFKENHKPLGSGMSAAAVGGFVGKLMSYSKERGYPLDEDEVPVLLKTHSPSGKIDERAAFDTLKYRIDAVMGNTSEIVKLDGIKPLPPGDQIRLVGFLQSLSTELSAHNWEKVIALCSPEHYQSQVFVMKMSKMEYIRELLDNDVMQRMVKSDLDKIVRVIFTYESDTSPLGRRRIAGCRRFKGKAVLLGGRIVDIGIEVKQENGQWRLAGAVG